MKRKIDWKISYKTFDDVDDLNKKDVQVNVRPFLIIPHLYPLLLSILIMGKVNKGFVEC